MAKLREKIVMKYQGGRYVIQSLENRMAPPVGTAVTPKTVEDLLLEAKVHGALTVKIV